MHTVYPCGYSVHAGQIEALMGRAHTLLIDLRKTPWSTMSAWRRPLLAERYEERYGWFGETLGNLNYNTTGPILLANPDPGIARLITLLQEGYDLVLLCGCGNYHECHRRAVVELLARKFPQLSIIHPDQIIPANMTKCLSIRQPWAWLICHPEIVREARLPIKDLENRTWSTEFRGEVLIHAGSTPDDLFTSEKDKRLDRWYWCQHFGQAGKRLADLMPARLADYPRRAIVGQAHLIDVLRTSSSPWFVGPYAFRLDQAHALVEPISYAGQLKLFDVPTSLLPAPTH